MSSGTTGVPVVDAYTRFDVECWEEGMARTLSGAGATRHDTVQCAYGYGLFSGGLGCTTAPSASAPTSCRCPRATRRSSSWSCATSARTYSAARLPTPCSWPRGQGNGLLTSNR